MMSQLMRLSPSERSAEYRGRLYYVKVRTGIAPSFCGAVRRKATLGMVYHKRASHVRIRRHLFCSQLVVEDFCDPRAWRRVTELEVRGRVPVGGATAGMGEVRQEDAIYILEPQEDLERGTTNDPMPQRGADGRRVRVGGRPGSFGCQPPGRVSSIRPLRSAAMVA